MQKDLILENKPKKALVKENARRKEIIFICINLFIPLLNFIVFNIYVNIDTVALSFQTKTADGRYVFNGADLLYNYKTMFRDFFAPNSLLGITIANSVWFFILNDFIITPLCVLFTYFLYKKIFMYKFFRVVFFMPSMIAGVTMILLFRFMFDSSFGVINPLLEAIGMQDAIPELGWWSTRNSVLTLISIYCVWSGFGSNLLFMQGAMARIPDEIVEAASLDGVGFMRELWSITIPLIGSTLATLYMLGTTVIFTFFLQVKLLSGGGPLGQSGTIMLYIFGQIENNAGDLTRPATVGTLIAILGTPFIVLTQKLVNKIFPTYEF